MSEDYREFEARLRSQGLHSSKAADALANLWVQAILAATEAALAAEREAHAETRRELLSALDEAIKDREYYDTKLREAEAALAAEREARAVERQAFKVLDQHLADWQSAAKRVGEDLAPNGPDGYSDFTPEEWREWALTAIAERTAQWQAKWGQSVDQRGDAVLALARADALLRELEQRDEGCYFCGSWVSEGDPHAPDCRLVALLNGGGA